MRPIENGNVIAIIVILFISQWAGFFYLYTKPVNAVPSYGGTAGFSICSPPFINLICYLPGGSGINNATASNACNQFTNTTACSGPCNNAITPPIVECGVSSGTGTGVQTLSVIVPFAKAFTKIPEIYLTPITASGLTVTSTQVLTLLATDPALALPANIPAADTEIPNHRTQLAATIPASTSFTECFFVTSAGLTALGKIKYSTDSGTTWNDFSALTVSLTSTGLQCLTATSPASSIGSVAWVAPFTTNGAGGGEAVAISNIQISFVVNSWAWMSINVRSGTTTATQFTWQVRSLVGFSSTFKVSWNANACESATGAFIDCPAQ